MLAAWKLKQEVSNPVNLDRAMLAFQFTDSRTTTRRYRTNLYRESIMAIEDGQGYKPHSKEKIDKVNRIKAAEIALGEIFKELDEEYSSDYAVSDTDSFTTEELDAMLERVHQIQKAKDRLKEASMWACRAVFQPEEKY